MSTTWLAFDYGTRRIGVAVGNQTLGTARPLDWVSNTNGTPHWADIDRLIDEWRPAGLVVGVPLTLDGHEQAMTAHARGFLKRLAQRTGLPTHEADERLSSHAAEREIASMRARGQRVKRTRKHDVDTLAAALILESWFASGDTP